MTFAGALIYWAIGIPLAIAIFILTRKVESRTKRLHVRALALALGMGAAIIPGHGEMIITPSTQLLVHGLFKSQPRGLYLAMGGGFFFVNWLCALVALSLWKPRIAVAPSVSATIVPLASVGPSEPLEAPTDKA